MGPSKPGTAKELEDWDSVKEQAAMALCYDLELFEPEEADGKFYAKPGSPADGKAMAEKAAALRGLKPDFVPAGPTLEEACAQLVAAMEAGAAGVPALRKVPETVTLEKLEIGPADLPEKIVARARESLASAPPAAASLQLTCTESAPMCFQSAEVMGSQLVTMYSSPKSSIAQSMPMRGAPKDSLRVA